MLRQVGAGGAIERLADRDRAAGQDEGRADEIGEQRVEQGIGQPGRIALEQFRQHAQRQHEGQRHEQQRGPGSPEGEEAPPPEGQAEEEGGGQHLCGENVHQQHLSHLQNQRKPPPK